MRKNNNPPLRLGVHHFLFFGLCFLLLSGFDPFQTSNGNVEQGNAKMRAGKVKEALALYNKAAKQLPDELGVQYNRGVALHKLGQLKEAKDALLKASMATAPTLKAKANYNLGNVLLGLKKHKEAVQAYTRSLRLNHGHRSSKWNLELALRRIKEEQKKKKKNKKDQNKQNKDNKDQNKQQQSNKDNKDDKSGAKKNPDKRQDKDKNKQQQRADKDKPKPDRKQMNSVLDALDRNDKNLKKRRAQVRGGGFRRPVKDW